MEVIAKDLNRLDDEHNQYFHSRLNWHLHTSCNDTNAPFEVSHQRRDAILSDILHTYAKEHEDIGYQQGMHEIASYLLFAYEMDLFDIETSYLGNEDDLKLFAGILDADFMMHDVYWMLERVMQMLHEAYEDTPISVLEGMDVHDCAILSKLKYVARGRDLYDQVHGYQIEPQLYSTRWFRLMFAREVNGWRNVLKLWDIYFDLTSADDRISSMPLECYTRPGCDHDLELGSFTLMEVLQTTAASRMWILRNELEATNNQIEALDVLTNSKPVENASRLISTILSGIRRLQVYGKRAPILPPQHIHPDATTTTAIEEEDSASEDSQHDDTRSYTSGMTEMTGTTLMSEVTSSIVDLFESVFRPIENERKGMVDQAQSCSVSSNESLASLSIGDIGH